MKNCYPKNATIVVSYPSIYLALKLFYEEHTKTLGQLVRFDTEIIRKGLGKYLDEPMYLDEILGELLFNGLIQENSAIEHFPLTYSITLKGAKMYAEYIETKEYLEIMEKAQAKLQRKLNVEDLFLMDSKEYTTPIAYNFFVSFLEKE